MRDIHSHILCGIDDGARTIDESINILDMLYKKGVTDIILTPHYIKGTKYNVANREKFDLFIELKKKYSKINLYLGNEVYIDSDLVELLKKGEVATLNNSKYLLVELPMSSEIKDLDSIIYDLMKNGIVPIIAHPERYAYIQKDITYLDKFIDMGALLQGNYESLFGKFGKNSEKTLKKLLKKKYISFLGSDIHRENHSDHTELVYKKLLKILKDEKIVNDLLDNNILKVINNDEVSIT